MKKSGVFVAILLSALSLAVAEPKPSLLFCSPQGVGVGYVKGDYGTGANRYRPLGVDEAGDAYVPVYVDRADETRLVAGHPVVADDHGQELFIQVTHLYENPDQWHVSVNNPTDRPITTRLRQAMDLPGLTFPETTLTLPPGEYRVLQ